MLWLIKLAVSTRPPVGRNYRASRSNSLGACGYNCSNVASHAAGGVGEEGEWACAPGGTFQGAAFQGR